MYKLGFFFGGGGGRHFATLIPSNYLIINYKHHKCMLSGQLEYTITFRDKKIHETQIIRDQLNNT